MSSSLETLHQSEVPVTAPETDNKVALIVAAHPNDDSFTVLSGISSVSDTPFRLARMS